jgi:hypothetical protein
MVCCARLRPICLLILTGVVAGTLARADEIRLKDGQKLYGVIVAYEDNMFKVKTDYGFVLVEKEKIAAIIPSAPGAHPSIKTEPPPKKAAPAKPDPAQPATPTGAPTKESPAASSAVPTATGAKSPPPAAAPKPAKIDKSEPTKLAATSSSVASSVSVPTSSKPAPEKKPMAPPAASSSTGSVATAKTPDVGKPAPASPSNTRPDSGTASKPAPAIPVVTPVAPSKAKEIVPPPNREALQGNTYINYTHGFRMYKAPSWRLIEEARKALPNAIVAMGTADESTLMVVGQEKSKDSLEMTAADVEKRLRETYGNYRRISQRKTVAGGFPAVEIHYRGLADDHDWSGTLLVVGRSGDIFSVLGMTYADTDLIQIQENVISRALASLEFNSN